ncbi:DUF4352 domain-containing protein [Frankia sp. Cpl3]|nr:DUF4352 domain-containing protein [Frankia sp. Cpl3]
MPPGVPGSPWPPYGWYPPQPPAAPAGTPAWHGWLLVAITVLAAAAVALSALTVVRDDREELARDLAWELNGASPEEGGFYGPTMSGMGAMSGGISGCPEPLGGVADLGPRSPDEADPVVAAGETVVLRYDMLDCERPVSFSLTLDNVRRQETAPEGGYPTRPRNGTYVVVDVTVQSPSYVWPDFLAFSIQGPEGTVTCPLFSDSMFGMDMGEPGSPVTSTLVFDVTDGYDLVRFDDPGPGSVSWRI